MPTHIEQDLWGTTTTSTANTIYSPNDWSHMAYIDYGASEAIATLKERVDVLEAQNRSQRKRKLGNDRRIHRIIQIT